eukprot:jgi/Mesvir1/11098/Mv26095-RA.1
MCSHNEERLLLTFCPMVFTFIDYVTCRGRLAANDPALERVNYKFLSVRQLRERLEELARQRKEWKLADLNVSRRVAFLSKQVDMDQQFMLAIRDNSVPRIRQLVSVALRRGRSVQFIVHQMGQAIKGLYHAKGFASDDKARDLGALVAATGGGKLLAALNKDGYLPARATLGAHRPILEVWTGKMSDLPGLVRRNVELVIINTPLGQTAKDCPWAVSCDEVATDPRLQYDPRTNLFANLCCEHGPSALAEKWESRTEKPLKMEFDTIEDIEDDVVLPD